MRACGNCAKWILGLIINNNNRRGKCQEDGKITYEGYSCLDHVYHEQHAPTKEKEDAK